MEGSMGGRKRIANNEMPLEASTDVTPVSK
jgi:hypothetical protein